MRIFAVVTVEARLVRKYVRVEFLPLAIELLTRHFTPHPISPPSLCDLHSHPTLVHSRAKGGVYPRRLPLHNACSSLRLGYQAELYVTLGYRSGTLGKLSNCQLGYLDGEEEGLGVYRGRYTGLQDGLEDGVGGEILGGR